MDRPIPPSHFKTQDGDVREDLRRIRLYLEQLNDWVAANSGGGGGSGDLTQAAADLLYLKRAANDFSTFAHKPLLTAADRFLLEDQAAAGDKKYTTLSEMVLAAGLGSPSFALPPASPGALDEEFTASTVPAGWLCYDLSGGAARVPSGAVDTLTALTGVTANPRTSFTDRPSWYKVQVTDSARHNYFYKPFTPATNAFYYGRLSHSFFGAGSPSAGSLAVIQIAASAAGVPDVNNRCYVGMGVAGGVYGTVADGIIAGGGSPVLFQRTIAPPETEFYCVWKRGTTYYFGTFSDASGVVWTKSAVLTWTPAFIGFGVASNNTANKPYDFAACDFVREAPGPVF